MKSMIKTVVVYYMDIEEISWNEISSMINIIELQERKKILEMRNENDKCLSLLGKLLLLCSLDKHPTIDNYKYPKIVYTEYGKPLWANINKYFNISHSGNMVVCASSSDYTIGIDIEAIKYYEIELFSFILTEEEYNLLAKEESIANFIKIWSIKEAVLKADGRGFFADSKQIKIKNDIAYLNNTSWFIKTTTMNNQYQISLASAAKLEVHFKEIKLKELIDYLSPFIKVNNYVIEQNDYLNCIGESSSNKGP